MNLIKDKNEFALEFPKLTVYRPKFYSLKYSVWQNLFLIQGLSNLIFNNNNNNLKNKTKLND